MYYNSNTRPFWMKFRSAASTNQTTIFTTNNDMCNAAAAAAAAATTATAAATATAATCEFVILSFFALRCFACLFSVRCFLL